MPILPSEPHLFPDNLFDESFQAPAGDRRWYVMHTRPQQEKSLARELRINQVAFYLPLIARKHRFRGRPVTSHLPLFRGYMFVLADPNERLFALQTKRVAQPLDVPDQGQLWKDLRHTQQLIASGAPITPEDRLTAGSRVVIRSGPLSGIEGTIFRSSSGQRFVVYVDFLQQGASVLIDYFDLAALN